MKIISPELAKRLYDKGVRVYGDFYHVCSEGYFSGFTWDLYYTKEVKEKDNNICWAGGEEYIMGQKILYAYTFDELWNMLPDHIYIDYPMAPVKTVTRNFLAIVKTTKNKMRIGYFSNHSGDNLGEQSQYNIAESAGLLLEWLIDNNHITAEDVNNGGM